MRELAAWRKTSVSRMTGTDTRVDQISQELAGTDRRQLVDVTHKNHRCAEVATALSNWFASGTSIIEHSSATRRSQSSGIVFVALELPINRVDFQQAVNGFCFQSRSTPRVAWQLVRLVHTEGA
jgi:hypothetical protein